MWQLWKCQERHFLFHVGYIDLLTCAWSLYYGNFTFIYYQCVPLHSWFLILLLILWTCFCFINWPLELYCTILDWTFVQNQFLHWVGGGEYDKIFKSSNIDILHVILKLVIWWEICTLFHENPSISSLVIAVLIFPFRPLWDTPDFD